MQRLEKAVLGPKREPAPGEPSEAPTGAEDTLSTVFLGQDALRAQLVEVEDRLDLLENRSALTSSQRLWVDQRAVETTLNLRSRTVGIASNHGLAGWALAVGVLNSAWLLCFTAFFFRARRVRRARPVKAQLQTIELDAQAPSSAA